MFYKLLSTMRFIHNIISINIANRYIIKFNPLITFFDARIVMATVRGTYVDDDASKLVPEVVAG